MVQSMEKYKNLLSSLSEKKFLEGGFQVWYPMSLIKKISPEDFTFLLVNVNTLKEILQISEHPRKIE